MLKKNLKMSEEIGFKRNISKSIYMDLNVTISLDVPFEKKYLSPIIKPWNSQIRTLDALRCFMYITREKGRICMTTCKKISILWKSR